MAEWAQGSMIDIDFCTFPFCTSSNTITAGDCNGLGVAPQKIRDVMGVTKAYCTRVGGGPFPTELENEIGEELRRIGSEFGATTGRPRRCGWIDLVALKFACMVNGVTKIIMTKADVLDSFKELEVCTSYSIAGKETMEMPMNLGKLNIVPVYKKFAGWDLPSSTAKKATDLPGTMLSYVEFINNYLGVKVHYISNGPGRDQLIHVSN